METKQDVIEKLEQKIDANKNMIKHDISYLIEALNQIDSALNVISYLSCLKDDFIKNRK